MSYFSHQSTPSRDSGKSPLPKKANYERYEDPSGEFGGQALKYSFWYVRHRLLLHRLVVGFLATLAGGTALFSLYSLGQYLIFGLAKNAEVERRLATFENYTLIQERFRPQPLQVFETHLFSGGVGTYDLVADIGNPNDRFIVTFDYSFSYGGAKTPIQRTTLLPGERRPIAFLGLTAEGLVGNPELVIEQTSWKRLSNHQLLDPIAWQSERLAFLVSNFEFLPEFDVNGANAASVRFTVTNQSAYSYKLARFYVGLYLDQTLVGIRPLTIDAFKSLESKTVDLRSFGSTINVTEAKVFPVINVYDETIYLPPER